MCYTLALNNTSKPNSLVQLGVFKISPQRAWHIGGPTGFGTSAVLLRELTTGRGEPLVRSPTALHLPAPGAAGTPLGSVFFSFVVFVRYHNTLERNCLRLLRNEYNTVTRLQAWYDLQPSLRFMSLCMLGDESTGKQHFSLLPLSKTCLLQQSTCKLRCLLTAV